MIPFTKEILYVDIVIVLKQLAKELESSWRPAAHVFSYKLRHIVGFAQSEAYDIS